MQLKPLTLSLNEFNPTVVAGPRNPIPYNAPDAGAYACQPGSCAYQVPFVNSSATNEQYFYCGYQARLNSATNCSISNSAQVMRHLAGTESSPEATTANSVLQSSHSLLNTSKTYAASQYGAIWFTRDKNSTTNGSASYDQLAISQCIKYSSTANYTGSNSSCQHFRGFGYVVQYNFTALHVTPMYLALADQSLAREGANNDGIIVDVTIDPLPFTSVESKLAKSQDAFSAWFLVVLSFPFIAGSFGNFIVIEKQSKAKHLQTVAGVDPIAYWLSSFLWDVINYQIPLWITVAMMFIFQIDVLTTTSQHVVGGAIVILFLFGPASAGFVYCACILNKY
jgi:hypothetical protein